MRLGQRFFQDTEVTTPLQCGIPLEVHRSRIQKFKYILFLYQMSLPWESFESIDEAIIPKF